MEHITVKLESFEGPFDLLFHLIEKNKIDIYDIPIADLTQQYIHFLDESINKSMDGMSEFLVMAATLLEIKSKMLLPNKAEREEEEDPRTELVEKLLEYKKYKAVTEKFSKRYKDYEQILYRQGNGITIEPLPEEESLKDVLGDLTLDKLYKAFEEVMKRKERRIDKVRSGFRAVERDLFNVEEKISYLEDLLIVSRKIRFQEIFREDVGKMEVVVTFLALLELMKMKKAFVKQENPFGDIFVTNVMEEMKNEIE